MNKSDFAWCLITHQPAEKVAKMIAHWQGMITGEVVILYGGKKEEYDKITHSLKAFISDPRLVTKDHPRERQSFIQVFRAAAKLVEKLQPTYVYFTEFDQIILRSEFQDRLLKRMQQTGADLLCNGLRRVDGTNHAHYLNHLSDDGFVEQFAHFSTRENKTVILSCWGFGQCWKREAFLDVSKIDDTVNTYLELWVPTVAYHLNYTVGHLNIDSEVNIPLGEWDLEKLPSSVDKPFVVHPIKAFW